MRDGIVAARRGRPLSDNPWGVDTQDYIRWRVQWLLMRSLMNMWRDDETDRLPAITKVHATYRLGK